LTIDQRPQMNRPLRSTPVTGASPLLRAGPPAHHATRSETRITSPPASWTCRGAPSHVLPGSSRSGSRRLHAGTPPGQSAGIRQAHPGTRNIAPVLMPSVFVTTRQQRFARARLPDLHLTPQPAPFPRSLTTTVFSQRSTRRFGALPRRTTPKGHAFISRTASSTRIPPTA
jgi:hypothetical protein